MQAPKTEISDGLCCLWSFSQRRSIIDRQVMGLKPVLEKIQLGRKDYSYIVLLRRLMLSVISQWEDS
jgi:hypothetical protein